MVGATPTTRRYFVSEGPPNSAWASLRKVYLIRVKEKPPGSDLFSHTVTSAVSSALRRFTSVFGMGTGGAASLEPPGSFINNFVIAELTRTCRIRFCTRSKNALVVYRRPTLPSIQFFHKYGTNPVVPGRRRIAGVHSFQSSLARPNHRRCSTRIRP